MKFKVLISLLLASVSLPLVAHCDDSQAPASSTATLLHNRKFSDEAGITDTRLRAEEGSQSRYSSKVNLMYLGPEVGDLGNPYQPDPDGSITHNPTMLRGDVALRLRLTPAAALNFGTGVSDVTPFAEGSRLDINNPFVGADYTQRVSAWQLRESIQTSLITVPEMRNAGEAADVLLFFAGFRNLGASRWLAGVDSVVHVGFFSRPYSAGNLPPGPQAAIAAQPPPGASRDGISKANFMVGDGNASQADLMVIPNLKYQITDQFGAMTGVMLSYYNPRKAEGQPWIWEYTPSQRIGLEYAHSRNFFVSPFVSFYPSRPALNTTTLNLVTVFSIL